MPVLKARYKIQIRDLDQTVIENPAHDLVRLALSLATAARGSNLPGITTAYMSENMIAVYEAGLSKKADGEDVPEPIDAVLQQALRRRWRHLAEERIKDVKPSIPLGRRVWALTAAEDKAIVDLVKALEIRDLINCLRGRDNKDELKILDAALRYAVLIGIEKSKEQDFCLVDIKEAVSAAAPHYEKSTMPKDNAKRVVEGARNLSPFLGERMLAARFMDKAASYANSYRRISSSNWSNSPNKRLLRRHVFWRPLWVRRMRGRWIRPRGMNGFPI